MHSFDRRGKRLSWRILSYALKRMRTDPPLDHSETPETLRRRAGLTVTPDGIGGDEALRIWEEVLAPACISVDHHDLGTRATGLVERVEQGRQVVRLVARRDDDRDVVEGHIDAGVERPRDRETPEQPPRGEPTDDERHVPRDDRHSRHRTGERRADPALGCAGRPGPPGRRPGRNPWTSR